MQTKQMSFQRRFRSDFAVTATSMSTIPVEKWSVVLLAATFNAPLTPETRSIAHISVSCDALTDDLMHSTYFFVRSDTAAAVAW